MKTPNVLYCLCWAPPPRIDAAAQARCFSCVVRANFTNTLSSGCSQCFYQWVGAARDSCLSCVEGSKTYMAAKGTCAYCVGQGRAQAQAQKCVACLQQKRDEYSYSCTNN